MIKKLIPLVLLVFIFGCDFPERVSSEMLTEDGTVVDTIHLAHHSDVNFGPTINMNGDLGMAMTSTSIPEQWGVVFRCQHGKFAIQGSRDKYKELWNRLDNGDKVIIKYKEVYNVWKESGKKEFVSLDFISADKLTAEREK